MGQEILCFVIAFLFCFTKYKQFLDVGKILLAGICRVRDAVTKYCRNIGWTFLFYFGDEVGNLDKLVNTESENSLFDSLLADRQLQEHIVA